MRTCGPDKSSKNDRKTQINIEIRDFFPSPKVCVCVGGGGGGEHDPSHQMTPMSSMSSFVVIQWYLIVGETACPRQLNVFSLLFQYTKIIPLPINVNETCNHLLM